MPSRAHDFCFKHKEERELKWYPRPIDMPIPINSFSGLNYDMVNITPEMIKHMHLPSYDIISKKYGHIICDYDTFFNGGNPTIRITLMSADTTILCATYYGCVGIVYMDENEDFFIGGRPVIVQLHSSIAAVIADSRRTSLIHRYTTSYLAHNLSRSISYQDIPPWAEYDGNVICLLDCEEDASWEPKKT